jgi:hypothetical protein
LLSRLNVEKKKVDWYCVDEINVIDDNMDEFIDDVKLVCITLGNV